MGCMQIVEAGVRSEWESETGVREGEAGVRPEWEIRMRGWSETGVREWRPEWERVIFRDEKERNWMKERERERMREWELLF